MKRPGALFTDLYQLKMSQAYLAEGMGDDAVFSLFFRELPERRNYLLTCGLGPVLEHLQEMEFTARDVDYLRGLGQFSDAFLDALSGIRFECDVWAMPEGTPVFPEEPLVEVEGPIAQAQLAETVIMNQVNSSTILAAKAARYVEAAAGRAVVDFGLRRIHGYDTGLKSARAFHVAGLTATSNVAAGRLYGVPVAGTMAHSYVQAHDDELAAFRRFVAEFPNTILLVDTYDTLDGVRKVIELARELGDAFRVRGVRLDSGDLGELATRSRRLLDEAGLDDVEIFASGGLTDEKIRRLVRDGRPIDGFGVGTDLGVSADAPSLDMAYKLTGYAGRGRMKLSTGKRTLPGRKQVFRQEESGQTVRDLLARADESLPGRPLLVQVMEKGRILDAGREELDAMRDRARREIEALPERVRSLDPAEPPFEVVLSDGMEEHLDKVRRRVSEESG